VSSRLPFDLAGGCIAIAVAICDFLFAQIVSCDRAFDREPIFDEKQTTLQLAWKGVVGHEPVASLAALRCGRYKPSLLPTSELSDFGQPNGAEPR
jgi:hypothetical protein